MPDMTMLANLINPEVMAAMISAELPKKLRAKGYMKVNTTLSGRAGDTITIPRYNYIGEAKDLAEGEKGEVVQLGAKEVDYTVKKAAQFVSLTDEAVLSGYGDPVGEVTRQLRMSIEDKIDSDALQALAAIGSNREISSGMLDIGLVYRGVDLFDNDEAGEPMSLLVPSDGLSQLRHYIRNKSTPTEDNAAVAKWSNSAEIEAVAGCKIIKWKKLPEGTAYILKNDALTIFIKRNVKLESARDILTKTTTFSADEHYLVAIEDEAKIVRLKYGIGG